MSTIKSITNNERGELLIVIAKDNSDIPHLIGLRPGDDVAAILAANSADLERMGNAALSPEAIADIVQQVSAAWTAEILAAVETRTPPEPNVRQEILSVSQEALASGFLHILMFDLMQRYLAQAQAIVPTVTAADLLDPQGPYYSKPYADTKAYYDQLVILQDAK